MQDHDRDRERCRLLLTAVSPPALDDVRLAFALTLAHYGYLPTVIAGWGNEGGIVVLWVGSTTAPWEVPPPYYLDLARYLVARDLPLGMSLVLHLAQRPRPAKGSPAAGGPTAPAGPAAGAWARLRRHGRAAGDHQRRRQVRRP